MLARLVGTSSMLNEDLCTCVLQGVALVLVHPMKTTVKRIQILK